RVFQGRFNARLDEPMKPADVGRFFGLNATVTDPDHNTSEFGPVIGAVEGVPSQIVFTSTRDGNEELYWTDGFEFSATRLTDHPAADHSPALSADGQTVAFVSTRESNTEIYLLELSNTTNVTRLTTDAGADYDPAWSPNG